MYMVMECAASVARWLAGSCLEANHPNLAYAARKHELLRSLQLVSIREHVQLVSDVDVAIQSRIAIHDDRALRIGFAAVLALQRWVLDR